MSDFKNLNELLKTLKNIFKMFLVIFVLLYCDPVLKTFFAVLKINIS